MVNLWFVSNHGESLFLLLGHHLHHHPSTPLARRRRRTAPLSHQTLIEFIVFIIWWLAFLPWCPVISPVCFFASGNVPYNNFINLLYRCLTSVHVGKRAATVADDEERGLWETPTPQFAIYFCSSR